MIEEALKLADELDALHQYVPSEAPAMIRRLVEELDKPHKYDPETGEPLIDGYPLFSGLPISESYKKVSETMEKYKKVLINIANDYVELSYDKARMQNLDHIKWAKEVLNETV